MSDQNQVSAFPGLEPTDTPDTGKQPTDRNRTVSSFSPRQLRAVGNYCRRYNVRPQLSAKPTVYFTDKTTGETIKIDIKDLLAIYDADRKEAAKERARARTREQRLEKRRRA